MNVAKALGIIGLKGGIFLLEKFLQDDSGKLRRLAYDASGRLTSSHRWEEEEKIQEPSKHKDIYPLVLQIFFSKLKYSAASSSLEKFASTYLLPLFPRS